MELVAGGRDADVYRHGPDHVLRRYRDGRSAEAEAVLQRDLASLGFPVPAVVAADGADLVMERVDGEPMATALLGGRLDPVAAGSVLADLHARLHGLVWPGGQPLLHLDLHPFNVLMAPHGPVVIDWSNARPGPAGLDLATTAVILAQVADSPTILLEHPDVARSPLGHDAADLAARLRALLAAFLAATDAASLADHLEEAVARRRADRYQTAAERTRLDGAAALARELLAQS